MEFVRDLSRGKHGMKRLRAMLEAVVVLRAAIEVDAEPGEIRDAREPQRIVAFPESAIGRRAERVQRAQKAGTLRVRDLHYREFFEERGAVRGDGDEKARMRKSEMQRAVAAHGHSGDGARAAFGGDAVSAFHGGNKFLEKEIFVARAAIARIDVEGGVRFGRDDEKLADFFLLPLIFNDVPAAGGDEELFVAAQSVKKI